MSLSVMRSSLRLSNLQRSSASRTRNQGAGLIEVLVAVLILAFGLLGMAGLQTNALKKNQSSHARGTAIMLSYYMLDAMRADRNGAIAGNYNTDEAGICDPAAITGTTLADNSRRDWVGHIRSSMGDEDTSCGVISCDASANCTVEIKWSDALAGGLNDQTFTTSSRL